MASSNRIASLNDVEVELKPVRSATGSTKFPTTTTSSSSSSSAAAGPDKSSRFNRSSDDGNHGGNSGTPADGISIAIPPESGSGSGPVPSSRIPGRKSSTGRVQPMYSSGRRGSKIGGGGYDPNSDTASQSDTASVSGLSSILNRELAQKRMQRMFQRIPLIYKMVVVVAVPFLLALVLAALQVRDAVQTVNNLDDGLLYDDFIHMVDHLISAAREERRNAFLAVFAGDSVELARMEAVRNATNAAAANLLQFLDGNKSLGWLTSNPTVLRFYQKALALPTTRETFDAEFLRSGGSSLSSGSIDTSTLNFFDSYIDSLFTLVKSPLQYGVRLVCINCVRSAIHVQWGIEVAERVAVTAAFAIVGGGFRSIDYYAHYCQIYGQYQLWQERVESTPYIIAQTAKFATPHEEIISDTLAAYHTHLLANETDIWAESGVTYSPAALNMTAPQFAAWIAQQRVQAVYQYLGNWTQLEQFEFRVMMDIHEQLDVLRESERRTSNEKTTLLIIGLSLLVGICSFLVWLMLASVSETNRILRKEIRRRKVTETCIWRFFPQEFMTLLNRTDVLSVQSGDRHRLNMTIVFATLQNFASASHQLGAEGTYDWFKQFIEVTGPVVKRHNGFIDKTLSDGLMAVFTCPHDAVTACLELHVRIQQANIETRAMNSAAILGGKSSSLASTSFGGGGLMGGGPIPFDVAVGIHSGEAVVGVIGNDVRMEGTIVSDTVNAASRINGLCKYYGSRLIVSEAVLHSARLSPEVRYRHLGAVRVVGRAQTLDIYDVYHMDDPMLAQYKDQTRTEFEQSVRLYQKREFESAQSILEGLQGQRPAVSDVGLHQRLHLIEYMRNGGVPDGWSGEDILTSK